MNQHRFCFLVRLVSLCLIFSAEVFGQDSVRGHSNSSVFKDYHPNSSELIQPSDLEYRLWENLMLVRKANEGDPAAEEELGSRYFFGDGFPGDTVRAAYWIRKAADHNMPLAQYNFGVFLNNGWGVEWNPFDAYQRFKAAAADSVPEAEFALGLCYTDNLTVAMDMAKGYHWIKSAADMKYKPAEEILPKLIRAMKQTHADTAVSPANTAVSGATSTVAMAHDSSFSTSLESREPIFLDFGSDTTTQVSDLTLLNDAFREGDDKFREALGISNIFEQGNRANAGKDSGGTAAGAISMIERTANVGSPEALTVLGRSFDLGVGLPRDRILAAEQYIRAAKMDSRRAPVLLLNLVRQQGFLKEVESRSKQDDYDAVFVWSCLTELSLDQSLDIKQAFHLLVTAADHDNIPALIELGRCYYTGQWTTRDVALGRRCWLRAAQDGSREANIRLAAAAVLSDSLSGANQADSEVAILHHGGAASTSLADTIHTLSEASNDGSIIGQLALGYCFEKGIGVAQNVGEAVRLYRNCAERGSLNAYEALKRLYDMLRPKDKEFAIKDSATGQ